MNFILRRRGLYWRGPQLRGYAMSQRAAWRTADRAEADHWASQLDAEVEECAASWQVTRFCCTSGMCLDCRAVATGRQRRRIVQASGLTKETAEIMARNWSHYDAKASEEPSR